MEKLKGVAIAVCITGSFSLYSPQSGATGFTAGYQAACSICESAIQSAFSIVDSSIVASEEVILESMGMGVSMATGAVGFPMLQATIDSSAGKQTKQIVQALELATKQIGQEVRNLPGAQQKHILEQTIGESAINHTQDSCVGIDAGPTFNAGGATSLPYGLSYLRGRGAVIGSDMSANQQATTSTETGNQITYSKAISTVASNVKNSTRIAQNQALDTVRGEAAERDLRLFDVIGGNLLISDKYTTIQKDSIEDDNLDLMAQLTVADLPSTADAMQRIATTGAEVNRIVDSKISRMGMTVPMAIQDRFVRLRRAHTATLGVEEYMLSGLDTLDGPLSDEGFLKLIGTKRVRDNRWLAITAADERFATQELAVMESEHLYLKYQKYLAKRDLNMALAQVVAKVLQKERP